ncbi:hypothetical protein [Candidatus Lokiarchaeum ossiferum]|uniref:hypothetical protein n=1 Tax=Candidatus Lokiarchaeum ossiferum TaxID=2951803 RepID=UPI00352E84D9
MDTSNFFNTSKTWKFFQENEVENALLAVKKEIPSPFMKFIENFLILDQTVYKIQVYDLAKEQTSKLLEMVSERENPILFAHILLVDGDIERFIGQLSSAREKIEKAKDIFHNLSDSYEFGSLLAIRLLSTVHYNLGEYKTAKEYCKMALNLISDKKKYVVIYLRLLNNLAVISQDQGHMLKSLDIFDKAFTLANEEQKFRTATILANNLADLTIKLGEYKKAKNYLAIGLKNVKKLDFKELMCYLYDNSSILYSYQGNFEEAEKNFDLGMDLSKKYAKFLYPSILASKAMHYRRKGNYSEAINLFNESIASFCENNIKNNSYIETLCNFADLLGIVKKFEEAYAYLAEAKALTRKKEILVDKLLTDLVFARIQLIKGDFNSANYLLADIIEQCNEEVDYHFIVECKLSHVEGHILHYQNSHNVSSIQNAKEILDEIISMGEKKHLLPDLIHAKFLQAVLMATDSENTRNAVSEIKTAINRAKSCGITKYERFGEIIVEDLERKEYTDSELMDLFMNHFNSMSYRITISEEEKKLINQISMILISQSDFGPAISKSYNRPEELNEVKGIEIAIFISVSVGQGQKYHEGFFGPLPIALPSHSRAFIYSLILKDEDNKDKRLNESNLALVSLLIPDNIIKFFNDRILLESLFKQQFEHRESITEITEKFLEHFLSKIKNRIIPIVPE